MLSTATRCRGSLRGRVGWLSAFRQLSPKCLCGRFRLNSLPGMSDLTDDIRTRPVRRVEDEKFLLGLYASTRDDLSLLGFDGGQLDTLVRMQFQAQNDGYAVQYPAAEHDIILYREVSAGRMIVQRDQGEIIFVDLAILPEFRNLGIGSKLIRDRITEAEESGRVLSFHAMKTNRAIRLYLRLGCEITADEGAHYRFEWRPGTRARVDGGS